MKHSKRYRELQNKAKHDLYNLKEAIGLIKESATAKFEETVEVSIKLGIDPKKDHVRGTSLLPNGIGKTKKVLVLAEGAKAKEAKDAGADFVGSDEYIKRIEEGWLNFDAVIATPELMPKISKFGKILGPRGLMPNPKTGTLTTEVGKVVKETKMGKVEFKMDKGGCLHSPVGKVSFPVESLQENIVQLLKSVWGAKPSTVKGKSYFKTVHLSSTMGPGIKLDPKSIELALKS